MKLQVSRGQGTLVKSAKWSEQEKANAIGLDSEGRCNGYVKRLTDEQGNQYELRGSFRLSKHAKPGEGHSVTSDLVLVRLAVGEDGITRAVTQIELAREEIVRVDSPEKKRAARAQKSSTKDARIQASRDEAAAFFGSLAE